MSGPLGCAARRRSAAGSSFCGALSCALWLRAPSSVPRRPRVRARPGTSVLRVSAGGLRWRRASRLCQSRSGMPGAGGASMWRQSRTTAAWSCAGVGRSVGVAVRAPPVICPVSRSVSYHSSIAVALARSASSANRLRTEALGGRSCDQPPPSRARLIAHRRTDTLASMTSDNVNAALRLLGPGLYA